MKKILSRLRRAVEDYNMIEDGDRIAVGISGGKDSLVALLAMKNLQRFYPKKFHLEAVTIDLGFSDMDYTPIQKLCEEIDVPYHIERTDIKQIVFDIRKEENPCSLCAKLRRGAMCAAVKSRNIDKVVYGHHFDDVINTYFLSLIYEGRMNTFSPVTYLERMEVTVIRPFIYTEESDIRRYAENNNLPVVKNSCPADKNTKRQYAHDLVWKLERENHGFRNRLFTAIQKSGISGWKYVD